MAVVPLHEMSAMYRSMANGARGFPIFFTFCETDIVPFVCGGVSFSAEGFLPVDKEDDATGELLARGCTRSRGRTEAVDGMAICCLLSSRDVLSIYIGPGEPHPASTSIMNFGGCWPRTIRRTQRTQGQFVRGKSLREAAYPLAQIYIELVTRRSRLHWSSIVDSSYQERRRGYKQFIGTSWLG